MEWGEVADCFNIADFMSPAPASNLLGRGWLSGLSEITIGHNNKKGGIYESEFECSLYELQGACDYEKVDGTDAVQEQLMKDVIAPILFSGEWRDERVNALSGDEKIRAYSLSLKIYQSTGDIEISAEEALMIKEAALVLNPGGYAQIVKLIDG